MTTEIRASASPGEIRVAVLNDGVLTDYAVWRPGAPDGVGDIHRGRVIKTVRAMAGAFVAIDGAEGFLPDSEGAKGLTDGAAVIVRVTRAAQGGKGPRLSARIEVSPAGVDGAGGVALLRRGPDPITRFVATWPDCVVIVDSQALAARLRALPVRPEVVAEAFDDALASEIDSLSEMVVELPGGARIAIHPTPALIAIDVDSGAAVGGGRDRPTDRPAVRQPDKPADGQANRPGDHQAGRHRHHQALNQALIPALARQIRLRNLSGAIVVDLAGLPIRRRVALAPALTAALADDPLRPSFLGFTGLGLAEILRTRVHPPLHELLSGPHAAGLAALRMIAANLGTDPRRMPALRAAPAVVTALRSDMVALDDLAARAGQPLVLRTDPDMREGEWRMESRDG